MSQGNAPSVPSVESRPEATMYGPMVQGNKNNVTKKPITNAPFGEVIF